MNKAVVDNSLEIRETIAKGIRILVREGLICNAGHISYRPRGENWFWTLRHRHVGLEATSAEDVIACDMQGRSINSNWEASGERFIYTEIFSRRPELRAIAHFHAPLATAFSIARKPIIPVFMMAAHIGNVPQYEVPEPIESPAAGQALANSLGKAKAALMRSHGAITVGDTIEEVCALAVMLEHNARLQHAAATLGGVAPIDITGRAEIFEKAFVHFAEVLWDHHSKPGENIPFLTWK